jgi:hypothetical protein
MDFVRLQWAATDISEPRSVRKIDRTQNTGFPGLSQRTLRRRKEACGAQKLIGDLLVSEITRFFVVLTGPAESPLAFLIERFIA